MSDVQVQALSPDLSLHEMDLEEAIAILKDVMGALEAHWGRGFSSLHTEVWLEDLADLTEPELVGAVKQLLRSPVPRGSGLPVPADVRAIARPDLREFDPQESKSEPINPELLSKIREYFNR